MSKNKRCARITGITDELTDKVIKLYAEGKTSEFWNGVSSLRELLEVKMFTYEEHIE